MYWTDSVWNRILSVKLDGSDRTEEYISNLDIGLSYTLDLLGLAGDIYMYIADYSREVLAFINLSGSNNTMMMLGWDDFVSPTDIYINECKFILVYIINIIHTWIIIIILDSAFRRHFHCFTCKCLNYNVMFNYSFYAAQLSP